MNTELINGSISYAAYPAPGAVLLSWSFTVLNRNIWFWRSVLRCFMEFNQILCSSMAALSLRTAESSCLASKSTLCSWTRSLSCAMLVWSILSTFWNVVNIWDILAWVSAVLADALVDFDVASLAFACSATTPALLVCNMLLASVTREAFLLMTSLLWACILLSTAFDTAWRSCALLFTTVISWKRPNCSNIADSKIIHL